MDNTLTYEQKRSIYYTVMESFAKQLKKSLKLDELSNETVHSAAEKVQKKMQKLIRKDDQGKYYIDEAAFKEYLAQIKNPARIRRLKKLYAEGKLANFIIRQGHVLSTVANSDLEWFRDNTDISLSPEFFEDAGGNAWGVDYKNTDRKPTKDEHDFYRFFTSMGQDTSGMAPEDVKRYRSAWRQFYISTMGIDPAGL